MPPTSQRRNTAYLNRANSRFGGEDRGLDDQALRSRPDLRFISEVRSNDVSDRTTWPVCACGCANARAPRERRAKTEEIFVLMICAF